MSLEEYYEEHKPKMPKLLNGAPTASTDNDDATKNQTEDYDNTGDNIMISEVQSISAVNGSEV